MLSYGKRIPVYETDGYSVVLRIFGGAIDERMAGLVARWGEKGRNVGLEALLVLAYLRQKSYLDTRAAAELLQVSRDEAMGILDQLAQPTEGFLERRGKRTATYHLSKSAAKELLGKAAYTRSRGLNPIRYQEMVREFVADHGSISPQEARELLGLGETHSARVEISRFFRTWVCRRRLPAERRQSPQGALLAQVSVSS